MTLPTKWTKSAGQVLGTSSLEMLRLKVLDELQKNKSLSFWQRRRVLNELDSLITYEQERRRKLAIHQQEREDLDHKYAVAQRQIDTYEKYAAAVNRYRIVRARARRTVARYQRDSAMCRVDVMERIMQIKAKYKPTEQQDDHLKELLRIKRQQKTSEAREQAVLDSIARRAKFRATFIEKVREEFPDMAEEIIDYYDQQIFQREPGG